MGIVNKDIKDSEKKFKPLYVLIVPLMLMVYLLQYWKQARNIVAATLARRKYCDTLSRIYNKKLQSIYALTLDVKLLSKPSV